MKKTVQKVLNLFIVLAMMFSMSIPTYAAGTHTITINDATADHTYKAYQLFGGTISTEDGTEILSSIVWGTSVTDGGALLTAIKAAEELGTTFDACTNAAEVAKELGSNSGLATAFAKVVGNYLKDGSAPVAGTSTYSVQDSNHKITGLSDGYYLLMDTKNKDASNNDALSLYVLRVTDDETVLPKKDIPTVEKKVLEDDGVKATNQLDSAKYPEFNEDYNDVADWGIGETNSFIISANIPSSVKVQDYLKYSLTFTDTFEDGFTITDAEGNALADGSMAGKFNAYLVANGTRTALNTNLFTGTLAQASGEGAGTITFTCDDIKDALINTTGDVTVVIEYSAKLNANANIGSTEGNLNGVKLEYSNDPYTYGKGETPEDKVIVFTFTMEGNKTDEAGTSLAGAKFKLNNDLTGDAKKWAKVVGGKFVEWTTEGEATEIVSDGNGAFKIEGLDSGTYSLKETEAPAGYNLLTEEVSITVKAVPATGLDEIHTQAWNTFAASAVISGSKTTATGSDAKLTIENNKGSKLPDTGDTGRGVFYALGAMGFSIAVIILITRKRMTKYK